MTRRTPEGFTIVEIIVAMTLTLAVFAITLPFVRAQTRALGASAGRLDADQLARYAQRAIDHDLRLASADEGQPLLVYAGPMAIAFSANLVAADTADPGAADIEAGAATTLTESWRLVDAATLPLVARSYPPQDYLDGDGNISHHETISWFLHPDTVAGRSDLYVLYRRVNARDSVEIVRGLQVPADSAFFSYHRPISGALSRIASSRLPLYWDSAAVDSVRAVGIRAAGYFRDRMTGRETIRTVQWTSVLPNATTRLAPSCGDAPGAVGALTATKTTTSGMYRVSLDWDDSPDDGGGAGDVRYYLIEWQLDGGSDPWRTLATKSASRAATYSWIYANPRATGDFVFAVRAVDCGGALSTATASATVTLP